MQNTPADVVLRIEAEEWVWTAQLTDPQVRRLHNVLKKDPKTEEEKHIH